MANPYVIHGGDPGVRRLEFLTEATWPESEVFLRAVGLGPGRKILEVGAGGGAVTRRLSEHFSPLVLTGVDFDARAVEIASRGNYPGRAKPEFVAADITEPDLAFLGKDYDFIYCRFLLSHLADPLAVLARLRALLRPGGILAAEDTHFDGHFSFPANAAFDRYVELFKRRGTHPNIGPELPALLEKAGLGKIRLRVATPAFREGDGKEIALLTLRAIREPLLRNRDISEAEFEDLAEALKKFTGEAGSILSLARIFQVAGSAG